jgi:hypothetical protein
MAAMAFVELVPGEWVQTLYRLFKKSTLWRSLWIKENPAQPFACLIGQMIVFIRKLHHKVFKKSALWRSLWIKENPAQPFACSIGQMIVFIPKLRHKADFLKGGYALGSNSKHQW